MKELIVNTKIHIDAGMRILTEDDVKGMRPENYTVEWPEDEPFNPKGVTMEEAMKVMERIQNENK